MLKKARLYRPILYPLLMLSGMWFVFLLQMHGFFESCSGAIIPLVPEGLKGIFFSPFLHGSLEHIMGNSIPIGILMFLLYYFYPRIANMVFFLGWVLTGLLVWLLPPIDVFTGKYMYTCIIGASGLVYLMAFFLFFSGIFRWDLKLMAVSLVVAFYYGSLIWGVLPEELFSHLAEPSRISWQTHLAGALVGSIMAFLFKKIGNKKNRFIWQFPNYYSEKDDKLWQEYKEQHPNDFEEMPQIKKENVWDRLDEIRKNH
ncbi:rhomboid family intramembrane serine protease [Halpernia humi]|nr:rhomboid family intramembrane serine protease [Halpernia humi]